jgi:class 3 adenylate cyclase
MSSPFFAWPVRHTHLFPYLSTCFILFLLAKKVCGLPEPCVTHALNMSKFARECLHKMSSLVGRLSETLGEDTNALHMRVGLHSGPVTAGVLRGDRARFQVRVFDMSSSSSLFLPFTTRPIVCCEAVVTLCHIDFVLSLL